MNSVLLSGILSIGKELIEDKDKKNEFADKAMERLLATETHPFVDAVVKLSYAADQITKGLLRPLGAAVMTAFGIYAHLNGIEIDGALHAMFDGAFPAWGASRHAEKARKKPDVPEDF